jgi:hypothetical protein
MTLRGDWQLRSTLACPRRTTAPRIQARCGKRARPQGRARSSASSSGICGGTISSHGRTCPEAPTGAAGASCHRPATPDGAATTASRPACLHAGRSRAQHRTQAVRYEVDQAGKPSWMCIGLTPDQRCGGQPKPAQKCPLSLDRRGSIPVSAGRIAARPLGCAMAI